MRSVALFNFEQGVGRNSTPGGKEPMCAILHTIMCGALIEYRERNGGRPSHVLHDPASVNRGISGLGQCAP